MAQFQQNVAILAIFKEVFILAYIFVFQCPVNLDFSLQLYERECDVLVEKIALSVEDEQATTVHTF